MPEVPSSDSLSNEFEWTKSFATEKEYRKAKRPKLMKFDRLTRFRLQILRKREPMKYVRRFFAGGNILDLGCGNGSYLVKNAKGFVPFGVDISPVLAPAADELFKSLGGRVTCAPSDVGLESFLDNYFEAAVLRSYLEHEHNPRTVLETLHKKLIPGGIAVVKVPNFGSINRFVMRNSWCGFRFPDHVNYFTPKTLENLATFTWFSIQSSLLDRFPTGDNMWAVLHKPR